MRARGTPENKHCQAVAMDAAIMLERPEIAPLPPCDGTAEIEVPTKRCGSFWLCRGCKDALDTFMSVAARVVKANPPEERA